MGYTLRILEGPDRGKSFFFDRIEITVGRTMENDLVLPDPGISRQHMSIRDKGGAYTLKDLGSSNGTKLNGRKVSEEVLRSGDVITLGGAIVQFDVTRNDEQVETDRGRIPSRVSRPGRGRDRRRPEPAAAPRGRSRREAAESDEEVEDEVSADHLIRSPGVRRKEPSGASRPAPASDTKPERRTPTIRGVLTPVSLFFREWTGKFMTWFRGLNKKVQITMVITVGILFIAVSVKVFQGGKKIVRRITDHSDAEFLIGESDSDGQPMTYGYGPVSMRCRERATFKFKYANGRATVTYSVAGINSKQEVEIQLNGIVVGYAPITLEKWSDYINLTLPRKHLLENEENRLSFINTANYNDPDAKEEWAVEVPLVEETPLPSPDRDAAVEAFKIAKERMKTKDVAPQNLYRALQYFKKSRDYLELLPEASRPDIYHEANEMVQKVERELDDRYRNLMFTAEQAKEFERLDKAKNIYRQVLLTIPNQDDPRHVHAKEKFDEIE